MRAVLAVLLSGCGVEVGYPDANPGDWFEETEIPTAVGCADEYEPNDFEGEDDYGVLGLVTPERSPSVCGHLSSLSINANSGAYTGDVDMYLFEVLSDDWVVVSMAWSSESDVDLHAKDMNLDEWHSDYDARQISYRPGPGIHLVQVSGVSGAPVDYALTVRLQ